LVVVCLFLCSQRVDAGLEFRFVPKEGDPIVVLDKGEKTSLEQDLDLGQNWQGELQIKGQLSSKNLSAEMRYETSLAISDEGAHFDLVDWQHFQSDWLPLKRLNETNFSMPEVSLVERSQFPFVAKTELLEYIKASGRDRGERWSRLAALCQTPTSSPCYVGISKIMIKIYDGEGPQRKLLKEILLRPAMGC
jgi:hypothetical protein